MLLDPLSGSMWNGIPCVVFVFIVSVVHAWQLFFWKWKLFHDFVDCRWQVSSSCFQGGQGDPHIIKHFILENILVARPVLNYMKRKKVARVKWLGASNRNFLPFLGIFFFSSKNGPFFTQKYMALLHIYSHICNFKNGWNRRMGR